MESCSYTTGHFRFSIRFVFCFSCLFVISRFLIEWYRQTKKSKYLGCLKSLINTSQQRAAPNCNKSDLICLANEGISRNRFRSDKISENYLIIVTIPSLTLSSIYSINASVAEQFLKQIRIQIKHNRVKNPNWPEANHLAFRKLGRGFELGTTENKSNQRSGRDLNSETPNCKSSALTSRTRFLLYWYLRF